MTARSGYCRRHGLLTSLVAISVLVSGPAFARTPDSTTITLPSGSLADMLRLIANRTGSEIVSLEHGLTRVRISPRTLTGTVTQMLDSLLSDTDYRAVRLSTNSFRIEHRARPRARPARYSPPPTIDSPTDIIVAASKFPVPLMRYPGSVVQMKVNPQSPAMPADDMDNLSQRLPVLQGTELGEGRNKVFIRGLVDSSFNGATQPTASIYFGDAPLGFGSPSPSLKLYDISSVEVLEGPQGTLYGSGSLGGIVRIEPNPVNYDRISGSSALGASATVSGRPGWDGSTMLNVPIVESRVALRVVGYHEHEGGYIDNSAAGQDSNSVNVSGGRAMLGARIGSSITLEAGLLYQETQGRDGQYTNDTALGSLDRKVRIAEPYASKLTLGYAVLEQQWTSGIKLTSVTSLGKRSSYDAFDATPANFAKPLAYQLGRESTTFAQEIRLARQNADGISWVVGAAYQRARDGQSRALGVPDAPAELDEVTNVTYSSSVFGQASLKLARTLEATVGLRWTQARTDSDPSRDSPSLIRGITARRADPTLALAWRVAPRTLFYTRLQTGYRNGGMAVARGVGRTANFESDSVIMGEIGARRLREGPTGLTASVALSYTRWDDIQADLITRRGSPYTANIGNARVLALEATADWTPVVGVDLGGSIFYTDSNLTGPLTDNTPPQDRRLPETPVFSGVLHADYGWEGHDAVRYRVGGAARYIGRSILGPGTLLDISQGDYAVVDLNAGARRGAIDVSLSLDNLFNTRGNRFAFGNPITAYMRDQRVPLRPTTVRLGFGISW
ncbi:MAG TPA: TonB-dependent receptor [Sphingobium sp.]|uniref:TonB-dependent receptor n=1 Tax=Sphingobium sp. TaxID=1912891 RepID=UPI002ECFB638